MGSLYPKSKSGKIGYFNSKVTPWTDNSVAIGSTAPIVAAFSALVASAQEKMSEQIAAEQAAKAATEACDNAVAQMVFAGGEIIKQVRIKAASSADPGAVYDLAQVPAPATPTPVTTLGTPTDWKVTLDPDGAVTIGWKCSNPRATGTIYQVWRKLETEPEFSYMGGTGEKKFTDDSVPAGSQQTMYKIQAVRSTAKGQWGICTVLFGKSSSGAMTASVMSAPAAKLAA